MTYDETVRYLYDSTPVFEHVGASAYKEGLDNTQALDEHFGHPHRCYKTIHVAGTNGKGSTAAMLASCLQAAGYRVGLFTSPFINRFNERIQVDGHPPKRGLEGGTLHESAPCRLSRAHTGERCVYQRETNCRLCGTGAQLLRPPPSLIFRVDHGLGLQVFRRTAS